jgi:hypothetical protein
VQVGQTCSELAREADADVVWCTLFLRRFGSDFWGEEATPGPHPYTVRTYRPRHVSVQCVACAASHTQRTMLVGGPQVVPRERNEWLEHPISDLFARFSLNSDGSQCHSDEASKTQATAVARDSEAGGDGEDDDYEDDDGEDEVSKHVNGLQAFVRSHATRDGYGGWKRAYQRCTDRDVA